MNSSRTLDSWIGRFLGDSQRYRLERFISSGGMGDVFLATDTRLGQQVALKLLKDTLSPTETLKKRFKREVDICAALSSEHIVQVRDCGVTDQGYPFYVMEYLQGESLGQLMRREKRLPVERTVKIIRQVCTGLQRAHQGVTLGTKTSIKVVHRDLKPDNIFLIPTDLGELVKILDFGIAKIRDDAAEYTNLTSTFQGTFRYAAPEQLRVDQNIDGRADIYSLGVILYEMLSGCDPFGFGNNARSTSGVMWGMAHTSKPPQLLRSQPGCEHLPAELEAIVMRCLQKAPEDRFASVEELSQALQNWMTDKNSNAVVKPVDETIVQIPSAHTEDALDPTEERPLILAKSPTPDTTNVQIPASPQQNNSDRTITQNDQPADRNKSSDVTIPQDSSQPNKKGRNGAEDDSTKSHQHRLFLIIGAIASLAAIGAVIAYIHNNSTQPSNTPQPIDICKENPNSLFCTK